MDAVQAEIKTILERWEHVLGEGQERALANAIQVRGGPEARMKIKSQKPVIPDKEWHDEQTGIQTQLAGLLPSLATHIWAEPDLRGEWACKDYIELFAGHYQTTIDRIRRRVLDAA